MSYTYNLKVVVSAVDRASRTINRINSFISNMLDRLKRIPLVGPAIDRLTGVFGRLGSVLGRVGDIAGGAFAALMAFEGLRRVEDVVRRCIEAFSEFEWTMKQVTLAGASSLKAVEGLNQELVNLARTVGREVGVGASQAAEALLALVKAGFSGAEAAEALRAALNMMVITGVSAEEASQLLVQALAAFSLSARDATRVVDALTAADLASIASARDLGIALGYCGAMAHTFGMSVEDALTAVAILTDRIGSAEKAGRYFDALLRDLIDKSDKLGVSVYEADGSMRPFAEIIADTSARLAGMTDEERAAYLETVGFTAQSARAILTLAGLGDTAEDVLAVWSSYREQIGRTGLAQQMAEKQMDTFRGAMMRLKAAFQDASITIGQAMTPALEKLMPPLEGLITNIAELLAPVLGGLANFLATVLVPVLNALNATLDWMQNVVAGAGEAWKAMCEAIRGWWDTYVAPIADAVDGFCYAVASAFKALHETLVGGSIWPETWDEILRVTERGVEEVHRAVERGLGGLETAFRPNVQVAPRLIAPTFTVNVQVHGVVREEADIARLARAIEDRVAYRLWLRAREVGVLWT